MSAVLFMAVVRGLRMKYSRPELHIGPFYSEAAVGFSCLRGEGVSPGACRFEAFVGQ